MRLIEKGVSFERDLTTVGPMVFDTKPVSTLRKQMDFYRNMLKWGVIICD